MKILIIEDQVKLANSIKRGLENIGYVADIVHDGIKGLRLIESSHENYDLVLLDIMLPGLDGMSICKEIRAQNIKIPIMLLTARDALDSKIEGLDVGADDYLIKPFEFDELTARIRALLRRPGSFLGNVLTSSGIVLDTVSHIVEKNGKKIDCTAKEFSILELFLRNENKVLSRDMIFTHVWSSEYVNQSNTVDVHIRKIRKKIQSKNENIFETVHGVGYRFNTI